MFPDEKFLALWVSGKSRKTKISYRADLNAFINFLGRSIKDATPADLRAYSSFLTSQIESQETAATTATRRFRVLKNFLNFCVEQGELSSNPAEGITFLPPAPKITPAPSREDLVRKGAARTKDLSVKLAAKMLSLTPATSVDLARVRWVDVFRRYEIPMLHITTRRESIPLPDDIDKILGIMIEESDPNDRIFDGLTAAEIRQMEECAAQLAA